MDAYEAPVPVSLFHWCGGSSYSQGIQVSFDRTRYRELHKRFQKARDRMMSGNLPDKMKIAAYHITAFARPSYDFEWSYAISSELASPSLST